MFACSNLSLKLFQLPAASIAVWARRTLNLNVETLAVDANTFNQLHAALVMINGQRKRIYVRVFPGPLLLGWFAKGSRTQMIQRLAIFFLLEIVELTEQSIPIGGAFVLWRRQWLTNRGECDGRTRHRVQIQPIVTELHCPACFPRKILAGI